MKRGSQRQSSNLEGYKITDKAISFRRDTAATVNLSSLDNNAPQLRRNAAKAQTSNPQFNPSESNSTNKKKKLPAS